MRAVLDNHLHAHETILRNRRHKLVSSRPHHKRTITYNWASSKMGRRNVCDMIDKISKAMPYVHLPELAPWVIIRASLQRLVPSQICRHHVPSDPRASRRGPRSRCPAGLLTDVQGPYNSNFNASWGSNTDQSVSTNYRHAKLHGVPSCLIVPVLEGLTEGACMIDNFPLRRKSFEPPMPLIIRVPFTSVEFA